MILWYYDIMIFWYYDIMLLWYYDRIARGRQEPPGPTLYKNVMSYWVAFTRYPHAIAVPYSRGGRSEAQHNSPHPFRGAGRDEIGESSWEFSSKMGHPASLPHIVLSFAPSAAAGWQCDRVRTTRERNSVRRSVFFKRWAVQVVSIIHEVEFKADATAATHEQIEKII